MAISQGYGRERRVNARYRVDLAAELRHPQGQVIHGRVRDICAGGLFLELASDQISDDLRPSQAYRLDIALPDDPRAAGALAEVVRTTPYGLGLRFTTLLEDTADRLGRFIHQAATTAIDEHRNQLDHQALGLLRALSKERLPEIFDQWIGHLLEALLEYSEHAESDVHRSLAASEAGLLIQALQSGRLASQVHEVIQESLVAPTPTPDPHDQNKGRIELALLDQEVFENWLVKSELSTRLEQELSELLGMLRSQATPLSGQPLWPIEPERLLDVLEGLLGQVGVSDTILRIGLRSGGHRIADALAAFYRALSLDWSHLGLTASKPGVQTLQAPHPEVGPSADPGDGFVPPSDLTPEPPAPPEPTTTPQSPARPNPMPDQRAPGPLPAEPTPAPQDLRVRELFDALRAQALQPSRPAPIQHGVQHPPLDSGRLDLPWTQGRVDLTDRLITEILSDQSTPKTLKTVLERIPAHLLSMALTHPGALLDERHPLTVLLDQVEQLARLLPNGARDDPERQQEFEQLVERLVATEPGDLPALEVLSEQMRGLKAHLEHLSRTNHAHWISLCNIRERHRQAREGVRQRINSLLDGLYIHPVVTEILDRGWRSLLEMVGITAGVDSPRWRRHWRTLWQLHLDTGGEALAHRGAIELSRQEVLLEEILDGLGAAGLTAEEHAELTERVHQALKQVRAGQVAPGLHQPFRPLLPDPEDGPDTVDETIAEADWNAAIARIDALPIGTLLWTQERAGPMALCLIWRSPDGSRLGLSDPLGKRLTSLRRSRLARRLLRQRLVIDRPPPTGSVQRATTAALERMESQIHEHDLPDPLTGLASQRQLKLALIRVLTQADPNVQPYALGILELDRLAILTFQYGSDTGEQILKYAADQLRLHLAHNQCLASLGNGRFGVLIGIRDHDEARGLGERLRLSLNAIPIQIQSVTQGLSWSLGFSLIEDRRQPPEHYLSTANLACLAAQRQGGDRVILFRDEDPVIHKQLEQMRICAQTAEAIRSGRIRLRFQIIAALTELEDGQEPVAHHSEILLSVYDERHRPLPLGDFIAAAEALNMMQILDRQVIETTLRWLNAHPGLEGPLGSVAVNVSGQTIGEADFVAWVSQRLEHWAIPPRRLGFEVTETAAITDLKRAAANLEHLRALGCPIYLDDFGVGLSSYGYLKHLPIDYLKIDGSFI